MNQEVDADTIRQEKSLLMLHESESISSVFIGVWTDDEVRMSSVYELRHPSSVVPAIATEAGTDVSDPHMGAVEGGTCATCHQEWERCPGHFGHIELQEMFVRPHYARKIAKIYSSVCKVCSKLLVEVSEKASVITNVSAIEEAYEKSKKLDTCPHCNATNYSWAKEYNLNYSKATPMVDKKKLSDWELYSEMIVVDSSVEEKERSNANYHLVPTRIVLRTLLAINDSDRRSLGISGLDFEDMFFSVMPVLPNGLRPQRDLGGMISQHMFTKYFSKMVDEQYEMVSRFRAPDAVLAREERSYQEEKYALDVYKYKNADVEAVAEDIQAKEETLIAKKKNIDTLKNADAKVSAKQQFVLARRTLYLRCMETMTTNGKQAFPEEMKFMHLIQKKEGAPIQLNALLKGKHGIIRDAILGKRVNFCARTVASPAPKESKNDEAWIPARYKDSLLMYETLQRDGPDSNYDIFKYFEDKGMIVYITLMNEQHLVDSNTFLKPTEDSDPWNMFGVRLTYRKLMQMIRRKNKNATKLVDYLLDGDVIDRQLIEGVNYIMVNRQPSIWKYSIGAFRVRWWSNNTFGIPDTALKPFNGDFDGDEFNVWTIRDSRTESEVVQVLSASRNVLGEARNATAYGLHYDAVSGLFLMTRIIKRSFPIPKGESFEKIKKFIESVHGQYFDDLSDHKTLDRVVNVSIEGDNVVFASEAIFPNYSPNQELVNSLRTPAQMEELKALLQSHNIHPLSGRAFISQLLPPDFYYSKGSGPDELRIVKGAVLKGTITKSVIGAFERDTFYPELTRKYGFQYVSDLIDNLVWLAKDYLTQGHTISFGLDDYGFLTNISDKKQDEIDRAKAHVQGYRQLFNTLKQIAEENINDANRRSIFQTLSEINFGVKSLSSSVDARRLIANYLTEDSEVEKTKKWQKIIQATASFEQRIDGVHKEVFERVRVLESEKNEAIRKNEAYKVIQYESRIAQLLDSIRTEETKIIMSAVDPENAFIQSHGKGGEIFEVMGSVGQQFLGGVRHEVNPINNRILASHLPGDLAPTSRGMVEGNFTKGITPQEAYFIDHAARIGPVITKTQTAVIGDMGNRLTNAFQSVYVHNGAAQDITKDHSAIVQFSVNGDNLASKYNMVRPGGSTHIDGKLPKNRLDYERKSNQTVINTNAIQNELKDMFQGQPTGLIDDEGSLNYIKKFLSENIVNSYLVSNVLPSMYKVEGISRITAEKTRTNLIAIMLNRILSIEFPAGENRQAAIDHVLQTAMMSLTGYSLSQMKQVVETAQVRQGDRIGALISGAVQQPIMQAAMDTFKKSGQTGSGVSVKDSFLRLTALTTNEEDYGFVNLVKPITSYRQAYEKRMKVKSLSLNDLVLSNTIKIHVREDNQRSNLPDYVKDYFDKLVAKKNKEVAKEFAGEVDTDDVYWMELELDGVKMRAHNLRGVDMAVLALQTNENARKGEAQNNMMIFSADETPKMTVIYSRKVVVSDDASKSRNPRKDAAAFFMKSIYNRLENIILNDILRGEENIKDAKPYKISILDNITQVYKDGKDFLVFFDSRECRRLGITAKDMIPALEKLGARYKLESKTVIRVIYGENPVKKLKEILKQEEDVMNQAWDQSVKDNSPMEPSPSPDGYTVLLVRYALMTDGNNATYTFMNPENNYRSSVVGDINQIVQYFGLRAARNFLAYELERLFDPDPKKPAGQIDYRHVVLMADIMVSTGKFGKLTYQGVDQMAGPNPINQMGVGFNPTGAIAKAAMTRTEAATTAGFAVGVVSGKTSIPYERTQDALKEQANQKERIAKNIAMFRRASPLADVKNISGTVAPAEGQYGKSTTTTIQGEKRIEVPAFKGENFTTGDLSWYYDKAQTDLYRMD